MTCDIWQLQFPQEAVADFHFVHLHRNKMFFSKDPNPNSAGEFEIALHHHNLTADLRIIFVGLYHLNLIVELKTVFVGLHLHNKQVDLEYSFAGPLQSTDLKTPKYQG